MQTIGGGAVMNVAGSHGISGIRGLSCPAMKSFREPVRQAAGRTINTGSTRPAESGRRAESLRRSPGSPPGFPEAGPPAPQCPAPPGVGPTLSKPPEPTGPISPSPPPISGLIAPPPEIGRRAAAVGGPGAGLVPAPCGAGTPPW